MGGQALPGSRFTGFWMNPDELKIIGLDTEDGPEHHLYDERIHLDVDENLVLNIMADGVLESVIVAKIDNVPYLVNGRRRVRAAREANKRLAAKGCELIRVPTTLKKGSASDLFGVLITTNEHRKDDSVWGKAVKCKRYMNMGRTAEEAANKFGVSTQSIRNWMNLFELDETVQTAVRGGDLSASKAFGWAHLTFREQQAKLTGEKIVTAPVVAPEGEEGGESTEAPTPPKTPTGRPKSPGKAMIRKVVELGAELGDKALDAKVLAALRWAIGGGDLSTVPEIAELIKELEN